MLTVRLRSSLISWVKSSGKPYVSYNRHATSPFNETYICDQPNNKRLTCPSVCLSFFLSGCLYLSVCLSVYLSVCLSICLSIRPSVCPSVLAARTREEKKTNKYTGEILPEGTSSKCIPLVFEYFGRWGLQADAFLHTLSKQCSRIEEDPFRSAEQFKTFWRKRFSLILQRCNAKLILKKLSRVLETKNDMDKLFDFNVQILVH